ncbi:5170_t:CDS:2, partial [Scutellospora calospora]
SSNNECNHSAPYLIFKCHEFEKSTEKLINNNPGLFCKESEDFKILDLIQDIFYFAHNLKYTNNWKDNFEIRRHSEIVKNSYTICEEFAEKFESLENLKKDLESKINFNLSSKDEEDICESYKEISKKIIKIGNLKNKWINKKKDLEKLSEFWKCLSIEFRLNENLINSNAELYVEEYVIDHIVEHYSKICDLVGAFCKYIATNNSKISEIYYNREKYGEIQANTADYH